MPKLSKLLFLSVTYITIPLISQTIRVTVDLVQVDAVVTDEQGRHVANLKPEDFQILEDGKPQHITHFSYERSNVTAPSAPPRRAAGEPGFVAMPAKPLGREQVSRSIVLIVDDLGLSAADVPRVRAALKNFIEHQMQPGDLASIMTTSGGIGALEQFTSDKRLLNASLDRIHYSMGRNGQTWYKPIHQLQPGGGDSDAVFSVLNSSRANALTRGSLAALRYAISGLYEMPGRKAVAFFSDGFTGGVDNLIEIANRASVVLYTFDARGLEAYSLSAIDSIYADKTALNIGRADARRQRDFAAAQQGMALLALGTGGLFFHDNNGLAGGLGNALDDMGSYYLIGYQPHREDFEKQKGIPQFHRLEVKVLRPGLHVRSRNGFMGVPDGPLSAPSVTPEAQLRRALFSPFQVSEVPVQLSAFYSAGDPDLKTRLRPIMLRAMLTIDARKLAFTDTPDGKKKFVVDIVVSAYGANNEPVGTSNKRFTAEMPVAEMEQIVSSGLLYSLEMEIPSPGPYQVRAAIRDDNSERTGSASYFLQIPDFKEKHLAISSVLLHDEDAVRNETLARAGVIGAGSTVTRAFVQGAALTYQCSVFGALLDKATSKPNLEIEVNLYRGEEHIFTGSPIPVPVPDGPSSSIRVAGQIRLPDTLPPGDYVAELVVRDRQEKVKEQRTAQWIDFKLYGR